MRGSQLLLVGVPIIVSGVFDGKTNLVSVVEPETYRGHVSNNRLLAYNNLQR